ncbi:MAG: aminotransferase class I/II-fold pyridoxal phosphate-dependent enzyme [Lachnospiraceae bacterium]|nr:aminotransferase class I/II-fold pyridoxal phosphate-dependent enzyme [Lachnospiraceae bacterium]
MRHGGESFGKNIRLDFSVNCNPLGLPEGVRRVLGENIEAFSSYPDMDSADLKEALARKEGIAASQLVLGNGASELIMALARVFSGKRVLLQCPIFSGYERAFRAAGCELSFASGGENFTICKESFDRIEKEKPELFVLCSPSNPAGTQPSAEDTERLAESLKRAGCVLLSDEVFLDFVPEGKSLAVFFDKGGRLIVLRAFTKSYAMAGLRLGYALCSDTAMAEKLNAQLPEWNISVPAQLAGLQALEEEPYLVRSLELIGKEREWLSKELDALGFCCTPSCANYILFKSDKELSEPLLDKGILIRRCDNYRGLPAEGYYRAAVRTREENMQLIEALREVING